MKPITRTTAALAASASILASLALGPSGASGEETGSGDHVTVRPRTFAPIVKKRTIAPGLTYTKITERQIPRRTYILRMQPSKAVTLDLALATASLPSRRTVQEIARANDALAAVNGDFTDPDVGRPTHPFAQDGDLLQTAVQQGPLFALSMDERRAYLGKPDLRISLIDRGSARSWRIARWNQGPPAPGEIAGYSPIGGTLELAPDYSCSVRLLPEGDPTFDPDGTAVISDYVVDAAACDQPSMDRNGGIVLSAAPATDEATELLAMTPGTQMRLRWSLDWNGVFDVVGGMPVLVQGGRAVATTCGTSFCRANPRTGIGYTENGGIILVVVDGRQNRWSRGVTLGEFAELMRDLGAVEALNLDGGGSTTMVIEGEVVNRPSDGFQRSISNAVLVLPGPDPGED